MNWLDLIIVIVLVVALVRGAQSGFVQQFFSATGLIVGIFLGAWAQAHLIALVDSVLSRAILALVVFLGSVLVFTSLGEYAGARLKYKFANLKFIERPDRVLGTIIGAAMVLVGVWLAAAIFGNTPAQPIRDQIRTSRVVSILNKTLPDAPSVISKIGRFINPNGFPQVFISQEPRLQADVPLPELGSLRPAVEQARASVVKITGKGCGGVVEGSGFVAASGTVITNAHVVAGVDEPSVLDAGGLHRASVVWFDPRLDIAVLRADGLAGGPLQLRGDLVERGTDGVVLGYPEGQGFTASPAIILERLNATGRDIYNQSSTERSVYSVKGDIRHGNSGGPLIAADGSVIGVVFAESVTYHDVGYVLTMDQVIAALNASSSSNRLVDTGACAL